MGVKVALLIDRNSFPPQGNWKELLECLGETILENLLKETTFGQEFDASGLLWSYKFFDSFQSYDSKYGKKFMPFDSKSFDEFEDILGEYLEEIYRNGSLSYINKIEFLGRALRNALSDLDWSNECLLNNSPEPDSRKKYKSRSASLFGEAEDESSCHGSTPSRLQVKQSKRADRNIIYIFIRVPRTRKESEDFVDDWTDVSTSDSFIKCLLPGAFYDALHQKNNIQVKFVDMKYYFPDSYSYADRPDNKIEEDEVPWNNEYPPVLNKTFMTLGSTGCVVPRVQLRDTVPGMPGWREWIKHYLSSTGISGSQKVFTLKSVRQSSKIQKDGEGNENSQTLPTALDSGRKRMGIISSLIHGKMKSTFKIRTEPRRKSSRTDVWNSLQSSEDLTSLARLRQIFNNFNLFCMHHALSELI